MADLKAIYEREIKAQLKEQLGLANIMEVPKITKITLNMGVGEAIGDRKQLDNAVALPASRYVMDTPSAVK